MSLNNTSGQAHPYWYEWFVGLIEVVKLLNPDEGIEKVAFQVASIQGWDDVVVSNRNGRRFYQVKHTRESNNLTFGSLVESDEGGESLIGSLFEGARSSGLIDPTNELVLYTNREDGSRWSTRKNGKRRPPLLEFWEWLKSELDVKGLAEISVPSVDDDEYDYSAAWEEWIACFSGNEKQATEFLRQLNIRTKEDDRDGLESRIRESLATAFGISETEAAPLFDALCRELRIWTTGHNGVTVEVLCDALTIEPAPKEFAPAPPPPTPFFPTRLPAAEQLQTDLLNENESPLVFLTGEPGSGKTSAVSWLANRRTEDAFLGIIGIRFFCFEPIRPEQPFISPDASRVKPEELWFSLLTQLRRGLKGRLRELRVPLRNAFLSWHEGRDHVLRLADILGKELGRRFVISIDGIDHAARAAQVMPEQIAAFFASLPSPDEVDAKRIRLLIAGQPPEYYSEEYPTWLTIQHPKVRRIDLPKLEQDDIKCLLCESNTTINRAQTDEAVRLIDALSQGNTLSIVFAVAEAGLCNSVEELESRLRKRSLRDGLSKYYDSIWRHALSNANQLSCSLAGIISLARTPITAEQLSAVFFAWEKSTPWWNQVLLELGPLLTRQGDGFLIRHNDVRVFLASKFSGFNKEEQRAVASQLVNHFADMASNRLAAHLQLFPLLRLADRAVEAASLFNVDWVLEGTTLGLEVNHLLHEGETAVAELSNAKQWSNVVSVSCALETLDRVSEFVEHYVDIEPWQTDLPPFLPAEASVRPIAQWAKDDFHQLVWDAHELVEGGDCNRARGLLSRWLNDFGIDQIVKHIPDLSSDMFGRVHSKDDPRLDEVVRRDFEVLGSLSAKLAWPFWGQLSRESPQIETDAFYAFEKGFVAEITTSPCVDSVDELLSQHGLLFFANYELAIRNLAKVDAWKLVAELLVAIEDQRKSLSEDFLLEASWYALNAGFSSESEWVLEYAELESKLPRIPKHYLGEGINLAQFINTARAVGWTMTGLDTGDIADFVCQAFEAPDEQSVANAMNLLFRTAAVVGRIEGHVARANWESARELFKPNYIRQLLSALWGDVINRAHYRFKGRLESSALAENLAQFCKELGGEFDTAALEAALPFAKEYVLGPRLKAIWDVVKRHGRIDVLRSWINKYIAAGGAAWSWAPESARETVDELVPLAQSIGMNDVAEYAKKRARRLIVGYLGHKEYSFERVNNWFSDAAENDPAIWSNEGWKLWELCRICDEKGGDNRLESEILLGISSAAIRHGKTAAWWRLVSTTLPRKSERDWHYRIREQFVDGYVDALAQGLQICDDEVLPIWSIALSLSYWFENGDTSSLLKLRAALLSAVSDGRRNEMEEAMRSVSPIVSNRNDDGDANPRPPAGQRQLPDGPRDENEWWNEVEDSLKEQQQEGRHWGYSSGLMSIARRRAQMHGNDELLEGLHIQLSMHVRWAFGGEELNAISMPELPAPELGSTDDIFIKIIRVLLDTFSVEVTGAALEGLHKFVGHNPSIISRLFEEVSEEWPRRWLLSAAESWAVLHPQHLADADAAISRLMDSGDFDSRLQAWVVLMRNAQTRGVGLPEFPLPRAPKLSIEEVQDFDLSLMEIPPTLRGADSFANRYSSAHNMIKYCALFGFKFDKLEGVIAKGLIELPDHGDGDSRYRGPHRYADFTYVPADAEKAFGNAVLSILDSEWCDDSKIAKLSQAVLPNEDSWVYRTRPMAIRALDEWPADSEFGADDIASGVRRTRMLEAAKSASIEHGWTVMVARVRDFSYKEDFDLHYWIEESEDTLLISAPKVPTCPGGRSFIWWIGEPVELDLNRFVSGLFVGGRQRLAYSHFEIRPPVEWRDEFGWSPNPRNPLEWHCNGEIVAKYERLHGVLRDAPHGPKYRQPFIDRWVVTFAAFEVVKENYPHLRERDTFKIYPFKE